jgi:hypothetical protein
LVSIYERSYSIPKFGNSEWEQKHGCSEFVNTYNDNNIATSKGESDNTLEEAVSSCDSSYPNLCIPPPPPDLDCKDVKESNFTVRLPHQYRFDGNKDA